MVDHGRDKLLSPDIVRLSDLLLRNPASRLFVPLAEAYLKSEMRDEALLVLNEGLGYHPTFIAALVMLGKIYFKMGDRAKARDLFEQAVEINPENIPSLKNLGAIYQEEGELQRALEAYHTIMRVDPGDKAARHLCITLEAEIAVKTESESTPLDSEGAGNSHPAETGPRPDGMPEPSDSQALARLPQAYEIGAGRDEGHGDRVEKNLEEKVETPTLASIYMSQGCYREAADIYNKLLARNPDDAESRDGLEEALSRLSESSKQTPASSVPIPSRREREIARLESWLQVVQTKRRR